MKIKYITIEREYGSGGTEIAAKLAEKCGLEFAWVPEKLFLFGMFVFV